MLFFIFYFLPSNNFCQQIGQIPAIEYRTVVPGKEYKAGTFFRFFFGDHWRDLWTSKLRVPVLDLNKFAGGLTPIKTGGGFQTKSLHFKGADGRFYKFRSLNKDPSKLLPEELQDSFVSFLLQDQISTSHPISGVVVAPLLNAVDILNSEPVIVILPDDPLLAEYRNDFKNLLGSFAENPKDDTEPELIFAGADKVVKLYKIFEELDEDNDNQVDAIAYLKVRLMDVFLGDWDRHVGQWKWARYKDGKKKIWQPIPRDRDQAFSRYDGLFPWFAALSVPQIENFDYDYPQINDLTWSGRHLDRRLLMSVDKAAWDSVTSFVVTRLTDSVIDNAVRKMPEEWYNKSGDYLASVLKHRRDHLQDISSEYYKMIAKYVVIKSSDQDEYADIKRLNDDQVSIDIYKRDKSNGHKKDKAFYSRVFGSDETEEIRLYLQGGDDKALISGEVDASIDIKVIGGKGDDQLIDSSHVHGFAFDILPIPSAEVKSAFYDSGKKTSFIEGPGTYIDTDKAKKPKPYKEGDNVNEKFEPPVTDWGYDWKPGQWLSYTSDDGLQIGGGPILIHHGFRADPYVWKMSAMVGFATGPGSIRLEYLGEFYKIIKSWRLQLRIGKNELAYNRFYGLGNEGRLEKNINSDFYRVSQELIYLDLLADHYISKRSKIYLTGTIRKSDLKKSSNNILAANGFRGVGQEVSAVFGVGWQFDSRKNQASGKDGVYLHLEGLHFPEFLDNNSAYSKAIFDGRFYYTFQSLPLTFAHRVYAENIWGDYYLFDAALLGGSDILRGFARERFAGDAAAFGATELRTPVFTTRIIIPAIFGISGHVESGRVFYDQPTENSKKWHASYGGGLWISYLKEALILNFTVSQSSEDLQIYFTTGFMF